MNRTPNLRKRRGDKLDEWQAALKRIKEDGQRRSAEDTRRAIVAYFQQISNKRVAEPARGVDCTHFACFDLATFLELQSKTPNWDCPFSTCKNRLSCSTVVIDEYIAAVLSEVDDVVVKIELLPSGAWKPVEVEHDAAGSMNSPALSDDIQVVLDKSTTRNQEEAAERTVPVSVLEELRRQIGDVLEQFNGLGYKRLGGIAASLADMNIFVKQRIREAREPASTPTTSSVPSTSAKPVATQTRAASATQDASSQTIPPEPSRDVAAESPSLAPATSDGMAAFLRTLSPETQRVLNRNASSQTIPPEPSRDIAAESPSLAPATSDGMAAFLRTLSPESQRFLNRNAQQPSSSATLNSNVVVQSRRPQLSPDELSLAHQVLMQQFADLRRRLTLPEL